MQRHIFLTEDGGKLLTEDHDNFLTKEKEKLLNFPCIDLNTIDKLWVKYSNGKFGFSIQKKIYLSVGGIADGQYDEQAWQKYVDEVGWSREGKPMRREDLNFDNTNPPQGHFPERVGGGVEWWGFLFSRIEICKL